MLTKKRLKIEKMNWEKTLKYICLLITLWVIPFLVNFIVERLNGDKGDPMLFTIILILFIVNIVFVQVSTKCKWWIKIVLALIVIIISITMSVIIVRLDILPFYDPYGIMTAIFGNGFFTIALWEIIFRLRILRIK
jgi:glucan phosphoethanolaminetransferase (alkaline phosphatase superfamily)